MNIIATLRRIAKFNVHHDDKGRFSESDGAGGIVAYHGTPNLVPEFSSSHIGEGEGAQAYGYGLYFADQQATAESYKKLGDVILVDGADAHDLGITDAAYNKLKVALNSTNKSSQTRALNQLKQWATNTVDVANQRASEYQAKVDAEVKNARERKWTGPVDVEYMHGWGAERKAVPCQEWTASDGARITYWTDTKEYEGNSSTCQNGHAKTFQAIKDMVYKPNEFLEVNLEGVQALKAKADTLLAAVDKGAIAQGHGNMYQVKLAVRPGELLDDDRPLSQQNDSIRSAVKDVLDDVVNKETDFHKASELSRRFQEYDLSDKTGATFYTELSDLLGSPKAASEELKANGIPGLKYLDQGSRVHEPRKDPKTSVWEVDDSMKGTLQFIHEADAKAYYDKAKDRQTHNYVIFDDSRIHITHVNGKDVTKEPAEVAKAMDDMRKSFDEAVHPRVPKGSAGGGEFTSGTSSPAFKAWFAGSKVVDEKGQPKVVYSGQNNAQLYGKGFNPRKSTAGAFYATEDPAIASNYATGKMGVKETYENGDQYRIAGKNGEFNKKLWQITLTPEQAAKAKEFLNREDGVHFDLDKYVADNKDYDKDSRQAFYRGGTKDLFSIFKVMESMGYNIAYADEGEGPFALRQNKSPFEQLLDHIGLKWNAYNWSQPAVFPLYLSIKNPLDGGKPIPKDLMDVLESAVKRKRMPSEDVISDTHWTKEYPLKAWVRDIKEEEATGKETFWATQVPKDALPILQRFGYDGIKDTGGKMGGPTHSVWLAFEPHQIKSAFNRGTWSHEEADIGKAFDPAQHPRDAKGEFAVSGVVPTGSVESARAFVSHFQKLEAAKLDKLKDMTVQELNDQRANMLAVSLWRKKMGMVKPGDSDDVALRFSAGEKAAFTRVLRRWSKTFAGAEADKVTPQFHDDVQKAANKFWNDPSMQRIFEKYGKVPVVVSLSQARPDSKPMDLNTPQAEYMHGNGIVVYDTPQLWGGKISKVNADEPFNVKPGECSVPGDSLEGILHHEYGHHVEDGIESTDIARAQEWRGLYAPYKEDYDAEVEVAMRQQREYIAGGEKPARSLSDIRHETISSYSFDNSKEGFAETFAAVTAPNYKREDFHQRNWPLLEYMEKVVNDANTTQA